MPFTTLAELNNALTGTAMGRAGIEFTELSAELTTATMPVAGNTQPYGLLHGGASALLAESVASAAANMWAGKGRMAVGVDLTITHMQSTRTGTVTGTARALHLGRTSAVYEIEIHDEDARLVAHSRLTTRILEQR